MEQQPGQAGYQVYVLRMWRDQAAARDRPAVWRCSLEDPRTRQRRAFASPGELSQFLDAQAGAAHHEQTQEEV